MKKGLALATNWACVQLKTQPIVKDINRCRNRSARRTCYRSNHREATLILIKLVMSHLKFLSQLISYPQATSASWRIMSIVIINNQLVLYPDAHQQLNHCTRELLSSVESQASKICRLRSRWTRVKLRWRSCVDWRVWKMRDFKIWDCRLRMVTLRVLLMGSLMRVQPLMNTAL